MNCWSYQQKTLNMVFPLVEKMTLLDHARTILSSAELVYNQHDYTSATILYFKVLFCALDAMLLRRTGKAPKDHTERFRLLETIDPASYELLDKYFPIYRDTYTTTIDKTTCERVRHDVKKIIAAQTEN